jgi:hypothetical protein
MEKQLEVTRSLAIADLKDLANTEGPCITMYMPLETAPNTSQVDAKRLKVAIRQAEQKLQEAFPDLPKERCRELIEAMHEVESEPDQWGGNGGSLVVLRSPEVFRAFQVNQELDDTVVVGDYFHIFPMIHSLQVAGQEFYLLALSKKHVRLLHCTRTVCEEIPLADGTPTSIDEWLATYLPSSSPDNADRQYPEQGAGRGSFTSTADRDRSDEHIINFFHVINNAVFEILRNQRAPLVLCGVDYERRMYRDLNKYEHLMEQGVAGSPDGLRGGEMHERALQVVQEHFSEPAKKALALWEKIAGGERAVTSFPDVVKAAFEARIAHLFAAEGAQTMGVFDRNAMQMRVQGRHEDLVNASALQTLAFGGDVFIVRPEEVPGGETMAAILRF